jgi:hypothetical protein
MSVIESPLDEHPKQQDFKVQISMNSMDNRSNNMSPKLKSPGLISPSSIYSTLKHTNISPDHIEKVKDELNQK